MADPFDVLGIARDASLDEALAAYRRLAAIFHPDHLQGMRPDVREEGERRLKAAMDALESIKAARGPARPPQADGPGRPAPAPAGRTYNVQLRDLSRDGLHADWCGPHAAAVWSVLRDAHTVDGPVRQVEWGAFECTLGGSQVRWLLSAACVEQPDWRAEPLVTLDVGRIRLVGTSGPEPPGSRDLGWLSDHVGDDREYLVTVETF